MKSLKLLFAFALVGMFTLNANAQTNSDSKSANVTASVITSLSVTKDADLDFGSVSPGIDKTVDPAADATAAAFTVTGGANASILVEISDDGLNYSGNNLPVSYTYSENTSSNSQSGSSTFTLTSGSYDTGLNGSGNAYYWIGGTVSPSASQAAGSYTGTVTMTATYN